MSRSKFNKQLYAVWERMVARCYKPHTTKYQFYGGIGVTVCDEWKNNFKAFKDWALKNGWMPGLQIDKDIRGDGLSYSPETCSFVTRKQNLRARKSLLRFEYNGVITTLAEICEGLGLNTNVVRQRISRDGLSFDEAISRPTGGGSQHFKRKKEYYLPPESREKIRQAAIRREQRKREISNPLS